MSEKPKKISKKKGKKDKSKNKSTGLRFTGLLNHTCLFIGKLHIKENDCRDVETRNTDCEAGEQ